ncbi:MAG: undecaprenyl-phosphate galactose phosphotransferase WbaP [Treponema sp.]|nr:undecaprenyl-phosphate galactose phosphotransferase WbaP [Treponema sp.]
MEIEEYPAFFKAHFRRTSSFVSGTALMLTDTLAIMLSIGIGFFIVNAIYPPLINFKSFVNYAIYVPLILIVFYAAGLYPGILLAPQTEVKRFSICSFFAFIGISSSINVEMKDRYPIAIALLIAWPFATILLPVGREMFRHIFGKLKWWGVPAVIYTKKADDLLIVDRLIDRANYGYRPALIVTKTGTVKKDYRGVPILKTDQRLLSIIRQLNIKVAILCDYEDNIEKIHASYRYVITVPKKQSLITTSLHMRDFGGIIGYASTNYLTKSFSKLSKRILDISLCLIASPFVLILTAIIAILIKIDSRGPVFFGHKRIGKNHKEIRCWKFRSMYADADVRLKKILETDPVRAAEWEKNRKFSDDPRVTRIGKFLRKTSLDEIPQLWNIFKGDMSFVGPRPVTLGELEKYGGTVEYVLSVTPGLSGMWQVSGRSDTDYDERIALDSYYIQNWSIWLDLWIVVKTIWVVLAGKGAY